MDEDLDQGALDRIATDECDCDEAMMARELRNSVAVVEQAVDEKLQAREDIKRGIKALLKPVAAGEIDRVTIKVDKKTTITITLKNLVLTCVKTVKDDFTIDERGGD